MLQNITNSIYQFEAEDIRNFTAAIQTLTANEIKHRYSSDLTPKTAEALTEAGEGMPNAKTLEKIRKKHTRSAKKATAGRLQKLAEVEAVELPRIINIAVEWRRSKTWGYTPSATVAAGLPSFDGGVGGECFRSIFEACGYEWRTVASGKLYSCYIIERRGGKNTTASEAVR